MQLFGKKLGAGGELIGKEKKTQCRAPFPFWYVLDLTTGCRSVAGISNGARRNSQHVEEQMFEVAGSWIYLPFAHHIISLHWGNGESWSTFFLMCFPCWKGWFDQTQWIGKGTGGNWFESTPLWKDYVNDNQPSTLSLAFVKMKFLSQISLKYWFLFPTWERRRHTEMSELSGISTCWPTLMSSRAISTDGHTTVSYVYTPLKDSGTHCNQARHRQPYTGVLNKHDIPSCCLRVDVSGLCLLCKKLSG